MVGKIFYCGLVNTEALASRLSSELYIGAGSNKMVSVVTALRNIGARAILVTSPTLPESGAEPYKGKILIRQKRCIQIIFSTFRNRYLRKLNAITCYFLFCVLYVKKNDVVIFYNNNIEYLGGLIVLWLKGVSPYLDIEDAPLINFNGKHYYTNRVLFSIFFKLSKKNKFIISHQLAKKLSIENYCVIYGAINNFFPPLRTKDILPKLIQGVDEPIYIHYGGTLMRETGVYLFSDALKLLINEFPKPPIKFHFLITGFILSQDFYKIQNKCVGTGIAITFETNLSPSAYLVLLDRCSVSLCLKMPDSEVGMTTFPSKVVEITMHGLLLISTKVSDIPLIFNDENSILLDDAEPKTLKEALIYVMRNVSQCSQLARAGNERALQIFSGNTVANQMVNFINYRCN